MKTQEFNPFLFYSHQLTQLFEKAQKQKNPALWLHQNNARSVLFMLEGLTRLHDRAFAEKLFGKWSKRFKKLEDVFGRIDDCLALEREFKANKKINKELVNQFAIAGSKYLEKCNKRLLDKNWMNHRLDLFNEQLNMYSVDYNKEYMQELKTGILEEIDSIVIFLEKIDFRLTDMELHLHDLRRRLRWLSIYGQALNGLIQVKISKTKPKTNINYFTKEILHSPYNKLPQKPKNAAMIEFDSHAFFALSWIINELGKQKDLGLKIESLSKTIYVYEDLTKEQAQVKAEKLLGVKSTTHDDILKQATETIRIFVHKDKMLDKLVVK